MSPKRFFLQQDGTTLALVCQNLRDVGFDEALFEAGRGSPVLVRAWAESNGVAHAYLEALTRTLVCAGVVRRQMTDAGPLVDLTARGRTWRPVFDALAGLGAHLLRGSEQSAGSQVAQDLLVNSAIAAYERCRPHATAPDDAYLEGALLLPFGYFGGEPTLRRVAALARTPSDIVEELARYVPYSGILFSYLPLYGALPRLLRSQQKGLAKAEKGRAEQHVDRKANVLATGQAHQKYFADADEIFTEIFNQEPLEAQPRFVCDMGCGDGTWLARVHEVVRQRTLRGQRLDAHPLALVGVDYNQAALEVTQVRLHAQNIQAQLFWGDIADPNQLASDLGAAGLKMSDGLHIRSFIDHNRPFRAPVREPAGLTVPASGAFIGPTGEALEPASVVQSFIEHLERWQPHVRRHGMVLLEAHAVSPELAWEQRGETTALTFDTHHALSQQYLLEYDVYLAGAERAGFTPHPTQGRRYPSNKPFVGISLHRFLARG